jgi:hypothetical protein
VRGKERPGNHFWEIWKRFSSGTSLAELKATRTRPTPQTRAAHAAPELRNTELRRKLLEAFEIPRAVLPQVGRAAKFAGALDDLSFEFSALCKGAHHNAGRQDSL